MEELSVDEESESLVKREKLNLHDFYKRILITEREIYGRDVKESAPICLRKEPTPYSYIGNKVIFLENEEIKVVQTWADLKGIAINGLEKNVVLQRFIFPQSNHAQTLRLCYFNPLTTTGERVFLCNNFRQILDI